MILLPIVALAVFLSYPRERAASLNVATSTPEEALETPTISFVPRDPIQGEPVLIRVAGLTSAAEVSSITVGGKAVPVFAEKGEARALWGIDLRAATGAVPVVAALTDGREVEGEIEVGAREVASAPLGIPEKLGGNTAESEKELVNTLVEEGKIIAAIPVSQKKLWRAPFRYPLEKSVVITDVYGYSRETGSSNIAHKGTDFRAGIGTPILAVNDGRVAYVGFLRNYGNVVAVDHGADILSIYMHLSKVSVAEGQRVARGERVGLSGDTGYVLGPHLHLTIRIDGVSVDPITFMEILGEGGIMTSNG